LKNVPKDAQNSLLNTCLFSYLRASIKPVFLGMQIKRLIWGIAWLLMCQSCDQSLPETTEKVLTKPTEDSIPKVEKTDTIPIIHYRMLVLNDSVRKQLRTTYPDGKLELICKLNRIDVMRIHRVDSLIIPDTFSVQINDYSPFPDSIPTYSSIRKIIVVSYPLQAFGAYEQGTLVRWGPVCMGKKATPTPIGLFHTNWKSKKQISTENPDWILPWYFNLVNNTGVSFHQFDLPGFPSSHSCIRMGEDDAMWMYSFAEQWILDSSERTIIAYGTPVVIFGTYGFGKERPWYRLAQNAQSTKITADSMIGIIKPFEQTIFERQQFRDSL